MWRERLHKQFIPGPQRAVPGVPRYEPPGIPLYLKPIPINERDVEEVLRRYTDSRHPVIARWLYSTWNAQREDLKYQEIRNAIRDGELSPEVLERWQQEYALLITEHLSREWEKAILYGATYIAAAVQRRLKAPGWRPDLSSVWAQRVAEWIQTRGTRLAVDLTQRQHDAVKAVIRHHLLVDPVPVEELARRIRPIIGLTAREAQAVQNYRQELLEQGMDPSKVEHWAQNYAGYLHRRRALRIARTETASAFNYGQLETMRQAVREGLVSEVYKVWWTARDERVCLACGPLHGRRVRLEEPFPNGAYAPPLHPMCRCTVLYEAA